MRLSIFSWSKLILKFMLTLTHIDGVTKWAYLVNNSSWNHMICKNYKIRSNKKYKNGFFVTNLDEWFLRLFKCTSSKLYFSLVNKLKTKINF